MRRDTKRYGGAVNVVWLGRLRDASGMIVSVMVWDCDMVLHMLDVLDCRYDSWFSC